MSLLPKYDFTKYPLEPRVVSFEEPEENFFERQERKLKGKLMAIKSGTSFEGRTYCSLCCEGHKSKEQE